MGPFPTSDPKVFNVVYRYIIKLGLVKVFASNTARVKQLVVATVKKIGSQSWDLAIAKARDLPINSIVPGSADRN